MEGARTSKKAKRARGHCDSEAGAPWRSAEKKKEGTLRCVLWLCPDRGWEAPGSGAVEGKSGCRRDAPNETMRLLVLRKQANRSAYSPWWAGKSDHVLGFPVVLCSFSGGQLGLRPKYVGQGGHAALFTARQKQSGLAARSLSIAPVLGVPSGAMPDS